MFNKLPPSRNYDVRMNFTEVSSVRHMQQLSMGLVQVYPGKLEFLDCGLVLVVLSLHFTMTVHTAALCR